MKVKRLKLFSLAKVSTREVLIQEEIQYSDAYRLKFFENIKKSQKFIRNKIIATKIFGAIIFGVLPVIPLLTYLQIVRYLNNNIIPNDIVVFGGTIIFSVFFLVQFFNFFLLGMISTTMIMSGKIFEWYESLPITRDTLKKLVFLTIFRSLDLPIIIIIFAFPIVMFIGTLDIVIFLICLSISLLNFLFSYLILIIFSERINRVMDINEANSKKAFFIRIFNLFSYVLIVVSSVYLIQWASESITDFFNIFVNQENTGLINLILSTIPYPLNPGYFIALFITPSQVPLNLWITVSIGLIIFMIIIWRLYKQSLKSLDHATISKFKPIKKIETLDLQNIAINIKIKKPVGAFLKKDLIIASRDLKSFMAMIMPVFLSFIFVFTYDISNKDLIFNWFILTGFNIIISAITVNGILKIEEPSETIKASLPIIPRHQAKAKLILIFFVYIVALISPLILYINNPDFDDFLLITLLTFPLAVIFLLMIFVMRVKLFGKLRKIHMVEEIKPQNKFIKWAIIFIALFLFYIIIFQVLFQIYFVEDLINVIILLGIFFVFSFIISIMIFDKLFPVIKLHKDSIIMRKEKINKAIKSTRSTQLSGFASHPWISTVCLILLYFIFLYLSIYIPYPIGGTYYYLNLIYISNHEFTTFTYIFQLYFYIIIKNLLQAILWIMIVPRLMKLPYGNVKIFEYFDDIGLGFMKRMSKRIILGIISALLILSLYFLFFSEMEFIFIPSLITFALYFGFVFWHEILFRGVLLKIFLGRYSFKIAIVFNALIYTFIINIPLLTSFYYIPQFPIYLIISFIIGLLFAYMCAKTESLIPSIIAQVFLIAFSFQLTNYWIFMLSEPLLYSL
ncbi:MAG: type II CAAX prenyl endopeptidase Rce1 family protein [Candidatus Thorarchaeota archaeon]